MSGDETSQATETLEAAQTRHRKEQRDLQSRITQKKKNATKKTRKGVNDECSELEREQVARQGREIAVLKGEVAEAGEGDVEDGEEEDEEEEAEVNGLADKLDETSLSSSTQPRPSQQPQDPADAAGAGGGGGKKRNRQKERLARRAAEVEAASAAAESEAAGMTDHRAVERAYMTAQFKTHGLVEQDIQPDGHCLFSAVADQLRTRGLLDGSSNKPVSPEGDAATAADNDDDDDGNKKDQSEPGYKLTRRLATDYMLAHRDDFEPFLAMDETSGGGRGQDGWEGYIDKMRNTAAWGGQLELTALANVYGIEIRVVQDGRTESITAASRTGDGDGDEDKDQKRTIWLAYYRHGYGLGEHYNSLRPAATSSS
ncbi:hypothetical protein Micbo1qcDRAFT_167191 [Microdochium bolleyi]|uniref:OTU domain-containing protein n=1 Tax=Microdochium bolleyi TaxID=196109 RepID=A0A136IRS4_9PEZI|nr:hypothetical protein Micbo1qcDRAFT_167191 [Microdochium bolleyi]